MTLPMRTALDVQQNWPTFKEWLIRLYDHTADFSYYGPFASDPTVNPLGGALVVGDMYYNTTLLYSKIFNGTNWERPPFESAAVGAVESYRAAAQASITADSAQVQALRVASVNSINADVSAVDAATAQALLVQIPAAIATLAAIPNRGAWVAGRVYPAPEIALSGGTWYICVVAHTASGSFATDEPTKWKVYQGITSGALGVATGATLVGSLGSRTLDAEVRDVVKPEHYSAQGGDVAFDNATAIEAAWAAAETSGRAVDMSNPPYRISRALNLSQNKITIIAKGGPAETTPLLKLTSTTANHINITGAGLRVIGRLSLGHSGTPTGGIGLNVTGELAGGIDIDHFDAKGIYEAVKQSEGAGLVRIRYCKLRNILGENAVSIDSAISSPPKLNRNLTIDFPDFMNDRGVNNKINWFVAQSCGVNPKIGMAGGFMINGTDGVKGYQNDAPIAAGMPCTDGIDIGPILIQGGYSDGARWKECRNVRMWGTVIRDGFIDGSPGTAVFTRGVFVDPSCYGPVDLFQVRVTNMGQHGIYLGQVNAAKVTLYNCHSTGNSTQTSGQFSNLIVADNAKNFEVVGGEFGVPVDGIKASNVLTFTANANSAYTLTLGGQLLNFRDVASVATDIQLGTTTRGTCENIVRFINSSQLPQIRRLTATLDATLNAVTLRLKERGLLGNSFTLSKAGSNMSWTGGGGTVSTTLLGGTGLNQVLRNIFISGENCDDFKISGANVEGAPVQNVQNKGKGLIIDCPGHDNPVDVLVPFSVNGTVSNTTLRLGARGGNVFEVVGVNANIGAGTLTLQPFINGLAASSGLAVAVSQRVLVATPINSGTGYTVGDSLVINGGTPTVTGPPASTAAIRVNAVDGTGRITELQINDSGRYSAIPTDPTSVTGGTGTGATFNLEWSTGYSQNLSAPYRFDARNSPAHITLVISLTSGASDLNGALLLRRVA